MRFSAALSQKHTRAGSVCEFPLQSAHCPQDLSTYSDLSPDKGKVRGSNPRAPMAGLLPPPMPRKSLVFRTQSCKTGASTGKRAPALSFPPAVGACCQKRTPAAGVFVAKRTRRAAATIRTILGTPPQPRRSRMGGEVAPTAGMGSRARFSRRRLHQTPDAPNTLASGPST